VSEIELDARFTANVPSLADTFLITQVRTHRQIEVFYREWWRMKGPRFLDRRQTMTLSVLRSDSSFPASS
jgi:hypothetical protein